MMRFGLIENLCSLYLFLVFCTCIPCCMPPGSLSKSLMTLKHTNKAKRTNTVHLEGVDWHSNSYLAFTSELGSKGSPCNESYFILKDVPVSSIDGSSGDIQVDASLHALLRNSWHLCIRQRIPNNGKWIHLGKYETYPSPASRLQKRSKNKMYENDITRNKIFGLRAEGDRVYITEEGFTKIPANVNITLRLFGVNFSNLTEVAFSPTSKSPESRCDNFAKVIKMTNENVITENLLEMELSLPLVENNEGYYLCVKETLEMRDVVRWIHQGNDPWLRIEPVGRLLPMWLQMLIICSLLILSGLFSGLNLGLMSLDRTELQVIENCGTETEKNYARVIIPLRKKGNYLLCSLLLGNVLVNSSLTILLDDLTSGIIAIVGSTISIVIFGEIIPQAICSRHGLAIGAKTVYVTKFFMLATFPLSFPISKILDCVLGEEIRHVYDRERLMEFIRVTKDYNKLEKEEVNMISGALDLKKKTVADIMTQIDDVFMVPYDAILNFETMSEIIKQGYSRIPVYEEERNNLVALLSIKDLAFVDPDNNLPLKTLTEYYKHPINYVFEDKTLDVMLNEFKKGRSRMAFIRHVNNEGDCDPFYEIIGVITLEDVIEEILQSKIIDETDVVTDNRKKQRRKEAQNRQDFSDFAKIRGGQQGTVISPQLALATYQFLSTSVEPFRNTYLSETVLKRLMTQNLFFKSKQNKDGNNSSSVLYQAGKPADYFVLILEGRCRVTVGIENILFEAGPFSYFGIPAITVSINTDASSQTHLQSLSSISASSENSATKAFYPDYTVVAVTETLFMKIHWTVYLAAYRETLVEKHHKLDPENEEMSNNQSEQLSPTSNTAATSRNIIDAVMRRASV